MDKTILQQEISGRESAIDALGKQRDLFIRAQGLDSSLETAKKQLSEMELLVASSKARLAQLQAKKNESLERSLGAIEKAITGFLPRGSAVVRLDPEKGSLFIGWLDPLTKIRIPHASLSGGEKVTFDFALAHALGANVVIGEFAEVDDVRLGEAMSLIAKNLRPDAQAVVLSCHASDSPYQGDWRVERL